MKLIHSITLFAKAFRHAFATTFLGASDSRKVATQWDSMVAAASEEWVDETVFRYSPPILEGGSVEALVRFVVEEAVAHPDLNELTGKLSAQFAIPPADALRSIDRVLGGLCRAATLWRGACPDPAVDPVGAAAFELALLDHAIIDAIYPGWQEWDPGCHSKKE